jgi:hypothetical protein
VGESDLELLAGSQISLDHLGGANKDTFTQHSPDAASISPFSNRDEP